MTLRRTSCVLCEKDLVQFYKKADFPIRCCGEKENYVWDMVLGKCSNCASYQQMNLLPSDVLYGGTYLLDTSYSPAWIKHHDALSSFICRYVTKGSKITEIGSSSQVLIRRLLATHQNYSLEVFDYSLDTAERLPGVSYTEGNCETFSFPKGSILVMSHVFEHLYEPARFVEKCYTDGVSDIILSLPNMNDESQVSITREHTYTYKDTDIEQLFSRKGYQCYQKEFYQYNHSIFFYFKRRTPTTEHFFQQKHTVPSESYLMGAGFYSQVIYHNIVNPESIIGIVDNDTMKQGKLFYNTPFIIEPFRALQKASSVIVMKNKYWTEEAVQMVKEVNPDINIHYL